MRYQMYQVNAASSRQCRSRIMGSSAASRSSHGVPIAHTGQKKEAAKSDMM